MSTSLIIRELGLCSYLPTWQAMQDFTQKRSINTPDELWLLEHYPIFTQGLAGKAEHILNPHQIPIIQTDRGGQVTYHGPGQLVAYPLLDLSRHSLSIHQFVSHLEQTIISLLTMLGITAQANSIARGVYVDQKKICSIGLRVRRRCSYHGIALNVAMDLTPFSYINPCGYQGMAMTQINDFLPITCEETKLVFITAFLHSFGYNHHKITAELPWS